MVANLDGIIFHQIYGDNSGGAEFDTDGDGTTTQEDEFVSFQNTTGAPLDVSGWQVWSDMTGAGAPDSVQDGLYHTFPPGTVIDPGEVLYIVNEISGTPLANMQEASEGGVESGAGGENTNFLTEGGSSGSESVVLVNPATGEYIVINMSADTPSDVPNISGFPGTTNVGETNAATQSGQEDQNAGSSYRYNPGTDSYEYSATSITCFTPGTRIAVPGGETAVEKLSPGAFVLTRDHGPQELRMVLRRTLNFGQGDDPRHKPITFKPGTLGKGAPRQPLTVSPQHRLIAFGTDGREILAPAKALLSRPGVRIRRGCRSITYLHLVFARHEVIRANGAWTESFYPGTYGFNGLPLTTRLALIKVFPDLALGDVPELARPLLGARTAAQPAGGPVPV